jgi:hypothetical protein
MAGKGDFAPAEWKKLLEAPLLAGFAISAADPSGFIGTLQEAFASARALAETKAGGADGLIKAVVDDLLTSSGRHDAREGVRTVVQGAQLAEIKDKALAELKSTASILDAKVPDEAKAFKSWLARIAKTVAESGTEGGLLGFGGVKVSEIEKATLAQISTTLGV